MLEAIKLIFIFYRSLICKSSVCNIFDKILSINLLFLLSTYIVPIRLGMIKYEAMFHWCPFIYQYMSNLYVYICLMFWLTNLYVYFG